MNFTSLLDKVFSGSPTSSMEHNFRKYGPSFNAYEFDDFVDTAKRFYHEAVRSGDRAYTVLHFKDGRVAVDYNGEVRAIYDKFKMPLAFFRPDYQALGYRSRLEAIEDFRKGHLEAA